MKKRLTRSILMTLVISMILSFMSVSSFASTGADLPIDKTANGLDENDQTDVTLTVPGTFEGKIDVVFVLGGGMTANMETIQSAINVFKPAMESGKATVRMGLISLEKGKEIILELNSEDAVLDPETYVNFVTEKFNSINSLPYGTTNLHSQLLEAKRMLDESDADPENQYLFVLATGRTYWFDDAKGEQATIVNKVNGTYYWGNYLWQSQRGRHTSLYMIPDRYNDSYEAFFADIEKWVEADGDKYVYTPHFDVNDYSAYVTWEQANNKDLKKLGVANSRYGNGIVNPVPTEENFITGTPAAIGSANHPLNSLNYERAQYECVQVWKELLKARYNCYSICSENPNYQNGSEYIKQGAKYTGTSTTQVGHSFMNYLAYLAGQGTAPTVWDYTRDEDGNITSTATVLKEGFFDSVKEDILYKTSIGTTVIDFIGSNEYGNFEFIENAEYITLNVGGVDYITTQIEANEGADSSYAFAASSDSEPTFWLDYYYGDGKISERFVWTFGENVSTERLASLTYKLQLTDKPTDVGTYIVPTNNSATLYPVDSDGNDGKPQVFPVPEVECEVVEKEIVPETVNVSGSKTWVDNDNQDGKRPESITIVLFAGSNPIAMKTVTAADGWAWTFENLPKFEDGEAIYYSVSETPVEGYTARVEGYNIVNTLIPEEPIPEEPIPEEPIVEEPEEVDIFEPEVPLQAPNTSDSGVAAIVLALASLVMGICVMFFRKRENA